MVECALVVLDRFLSSLQCGPNSGQPFVFAGQSLTPVPSSLDRINQEGINEQRVILGTLFVRLRDLSARQEANGCGASPGRGTADRSDVRFDEPSPGGTEDPDLRTRCSALPCSNRQGLCDSWDLWVPPNRPFAGAPNRPFARVTSADPGVDLARMHS